MPRPPYVPPLVTSDRFPLALASAQDQVALGDGAWRAVEVAAGHAPAQLTRLALAGVDLCVGCADRGLAEHLARRWRQFTANRDDGWSVAVTVAAVERLPFETPVAFVASARRDDRYLLALRGVAVIVDPTRGRATALVERRHPDQDLANLIRLLLWAFAPKAGRFLVHAAAVDTAAGTVLLVGPAQSGKSTAARLAAPRAVLTDDAVLLGIAGDQVVAATAGLRGREGSDGLAVGFDRVERRVAGIVTLRKAATNQITQLPPARAALELMCATSLITRDRATRDDALAMADDAVRKVPALVLAFRKDDGSFWPLVEQALAARTAEPSGAA